MKPFQFAKGRWYVATNGLYLHNDGILRDFCHSNTCKTSGWYRTRKLAREAIRQHRQQPRFAKICLTFTIPIPATNLKTDAQIIKSLTKELSRGQNDSVSVSYDAG